MLSAAFSAGNAVLLSQFGEPVILHIGAIRQVVTGIYSAGHGESRVGGGSRSGAPINPENQTLQLSTQYVEENSIGKNTQVEIADKLFKIIDTPRPDGTGLSVMSIRAI